MIVLPTDLDSGVRILGVDPGTRRLGVATLTVEAKSLSILDVEAFTIKSTPEEEAEYSDIHQDRKLRILYGQQRRFMEVLATRNPHVVCIEAPFYNPKRPGAFGPLAEVVSALKLAIMDYNIDLTIKVYPPDIIKKEMSCHRGRDYTIDPKVLIRSKIDSINEIIEVADPPKLFWDQHSYDAIAVGYTYVQQSRRSKL